MQHFRICSTPPKIRPFTNYFVSDKAPPESWKYLNPGEHAQPVIGAMQVEPTKE